MTKIAFLGSGPESDFKVLQPLLSLMGQKTVRGGPVKTGAAFKLVVNGLLGLQVVGLSELLAFSEAEGLPKERCSELLSALPVTSAAASSALPFITTGKHPDWFPVELVEKDFSPFVGAFPWPGAVSAAFSRLRTLRA